MLAQAGANTGIAPAAQSPRLRREPAGYRLDVDPASLDLTRFRAAAVVISAVSGTAGVGKTALAVH